MSSVSVDRPGLYRFLMAMRDKQGAFKMHEGGEVDIRSAEIIIIMTITEYRSCVRVEVAVLGSPS